MKTGRCSESGFPHKGWELVTVYDINPEGELSYDQYPTCEFCGIATIRYIHVLEHPTFSEPVEVGCDCAQTLTEDYVNPKERERKVRNQSSRRKRFSKRKWKQSRKGNLWIELDGHHVVVTENRDGTFQLCIDKQRGRLTFATLEAAQRRAFDVVQQKVRREEKR